ncbi:MAG: AAA family ATPase [Pseudomonadota bacterium]
MDVGAWLRDLGLGEYAETFRDNDVTGDLLATLDADDLRDLGVDKVGHRRRILNAVANLQAAAEPVAAPALQEGAFERPERRHLTILVCDIADSTPLATRLDAEVFRNLVARFQQRCAEAVRQFGGFVGPFLGDAVIAYFGYPRSLENDAESALKAGLAIVRRLERADDLLEPIAVRIGVATGLVIVGKLDDTSAPEEHTVIGETPNLAVRLQTQAAPNTVVCASTTRQLAGELFRFEPLGRIAVKGFEAPVAVWRVAGETAAETRFAATRTATIGRLVGRTEERALLLERWATARRGEGQAVVITGPPGIGKSRLVGSLVDDVEASGGTSHLFQCSPLFAQSPLYPIVRHLEAAARVSDGDAPDERLRKLKRYLTDRDADPSFADELAALLLEPGELGPDATPERLRADTFNALVKLVVGPRTGQPLMLVLEDVHWIDPSTRELAERVLAKLAKRPLLFVMTARPDADIRWTKIGDPSALELSRLNRSQAAEFLQEIFEDRVISIPVARRIIDRTDGVPLFIEEVCRGLIESGCLQPDANDRLDPDAVLGFVPTTLNDTLLSRLDRNVVGKTVAQVASVIGREFHAELLRAIYPRPADELDQGLDALVASDLIHPVAGISPGTFAFKHGLMHQAAYETLLLRHRQELHLKIVDLAPTILPTLVRRRPEVLARHLSLAGEHRRAAAQWLLAGRQALGRGAYEETSEHLRAGLADIAQLEETDSRDELELPLQMCLAQALRSARFTGGDDALNACQRARDLASVLGRSEDLLLVLRLEFGILFNRPDVDGAEAVAQAFADVERLGGLPEAAALGFQAMGKVHFFRGDFTAAHTTMVRAVEPRDGFRMADLLNHYQYPVSAMVYRAFAAFCLGRISEADEVAAEAVAISRQGSPFTHSLTLANLLIVELMRRGSPAGHVMLSELTGIAVARGAPFWVDLVGFHEGWESIARGDPPEPGIALMQRALETFQENSVEVEVPFYQTVLAEALLDQGSNAEARVVLADAEARVARTQESWPLPEILRLRMRLAEASGERPTAERLLVEARSLCDQQRAAVWRLRLELTGHAAGLSTQGDIEAALRPFENERPTADVGTGRALLAAAAPA